MKRTSWLGVVLACLVFAGIGSAWLTKEPGSQRAAMSAASTIDVAESEDRRPSPPAAAPLVGVGMSQAAALAPLKEASPAATPAPEPTILIDGRWPAREVRPGHPIRRSPVERSPGYVPPDDPESTAVVTGRRAVGSTDRRLTGGFASATALAEALVDCVHRSDFQRLRDLMITYEEFRDILWPEFPQSRPATNVRAEDAWEFHFRSSITGARRMVDDWGGRDVHLTGLSFDQGRVSYTNFKLALGVRLHAVDVATGEAIVIKYADGFVERDGVWKVYIYRD